MKQNKLTMMAVTIFVAMALTACGAQGQNNSTNTGSSTSTSSQSSSESSSQVQQISSVFGRVSQVAGKLFTPANTTNGVGFLYEKGQNVEHGSALSPLFLPR